MIGTVIKKGNTIYAYDEKGRTLCTKSGDEVVGYTGTSFSVKKGKNVYIYDEKGRTLSTKHC